MNSFIFAFAAMAAIAISSSAMAQSFAHLSPAQVIQEQTAIQAENAQAQARWSALHAAPMGSVPKQEAGSVNATPAS